MLTGLAAKSDPVLDKKPLSFSMSLLVMHGSKFDANTGDKLDENQLVRGR